MVIIIDAYNILKQISSTVYIQEEQRQQFLKRVDIYGRRTGHSMICVFDGGETARPHHSKHGICTVIYAGTHVNADEVIKTLTDRYKQKEVIVVSSDGQICLYAQQRGIVSVDALAFYQLLKASVLPALHMTQIKKSTASAHRFGPERPEIDTFMEEVTQIMMYKEEDEESRALHRGRQLSRQEKKIRKVLKKL